jgi:putative ATP-dependent endonuclease of OLD family
MQLASSVKTCLPRRLPLLLVTEGITDIEFLKAIAGMLRAQDPSIPDLAALEAGGQLVFVPIGGGQIAAWSNRLSSLANPRFQLHDRETGEEAIRREAAAHAVRSPDCIVYLTRKRALENYLHPEAIEAAGGPSVRVTDFCDVASAVAAAQFAASAEQAAWDLLSPRARKRFACRAKRWLTTQAVACMMPQLLDERDPDGEVRMWLSQIARLAPLAP